MKVYYFVLLFSTCFIMTAQSQTGIFDKSEDVGKVKLAGSASYDAQSEKYTIKAAGTNIWGNKDEFHYVWKKVSGDFILYGMLDFKGKGVNPHRKAGFMLRKTLEPGSAYADIAIHGDGLTSLQYRLRDNDATQEIKSIQAHFNIIQLQKEGNQIIVKAAHSGEPLQQVGSLTVDFTDKEFYVGLYACSHDSDVVEEAHFQNVRLSVPAWEGLVPYKDYLSSRLEIMDVETGIRKVIYESAVPFEAPNWTRDGKFLIVNSKGKLYKIPATGGNLEEINSGFATSNNNDHGLSPDGTQLAISHHAADRDGASTIYILPLNGGEPKVITDKSPSYWHGWSPDNKFLAYTAKRDDYFNIYRIPVNRGKEERLTETPALDDGPEYSPDGKYIYLNSNRTGTMQIWRIDADGKNPVQLTFDDYNDWFPHISPDGKNMIFISYPNTVPSGDHPYYKHVMLRMMPVSGGAPKVLTHLYGGQGTMNVPSWSPDSKRVAFVSNTR